MAFVTRERNARQERGSLVVRLDVLKHEGNSTELVETSRTAVSIRGYGTRRFLHADLENCGPNCPPQLPGRCLQSGLAKDERRK